ncbi:hypothetical protein B296_00002363 [Ensete ventricosum]|uniref:PITH domain-containing protein n=2 Tax=Magnoliopsida TaxID=3398 RepID=A0A427B3E0_ENSVE|nr:hypothetical protein B296_00002363 [Ensete ventricosum]
MDDHDNTSEEATSARGTKSASDLESEVEVPEHDAAWPMPPPYASAAARPPYVSAISRGMTKDRHPRDGPRDTPTELPVEDPRGSINPQEVLTPTDVGGLAHSDENRSSRHLSSTYESFVSAHIKKRTDQDLAARCAPRLSNGSNRDVCCSVEGYVQEARRSTRSQTSRWPRGAEPLGLGDTEAKESASCHAVLVRTTGRVSYLHLQVSALNEAVAGSVKSVFKPWNRRLDTSEGFLESNDGDPELLVFIPFTSDVKIKSISVVGGSGGTSPSKMRAYDSPHEATCLHVCFLIYLNEILPSFRHLIATLIMLLFQLKRDVVATIVYEITPNPSDHK